MPAFTATSPAKIILFGEHAVVYGQPAIAAPIPELKVRCVVTPLIGKESGEILIEAEEIGLSARAADLPEDHPLRAALDQVLDQRPLMDSPACRIEISSSIPSAAGLGSSAAAAASLIRAFAGFLGSRLSDQEISQKTYQVEKIQHGTPSGIDNTVISYQVPILFNKGQAFQALKIPKPFSILVAHSGIPGDTRQAVEKVREAWKEDRERYQGMFSEIGQISRQAAELIENGTIPQIGPLMDHNHQLLQELGVSTPDLDHLVGIAREGGALGAKLSGGGLGGHLIALVDEHTDQLQSRLLAAGATAAWMTRISKKSTQID